MDLKKKMKNNVNKNIGFIGTGNIWNPICCNFLKRKIKLNISNRSFNKAKNLIKAGAIWENSIAILSQENKIIFTCLSTHHDVKEVYLAKEGILENTKTGTICVDLSTSDPE